MLDLIWIILIGAVVGALAKFILPGADPGGFFVTALLGMGERSRPRSWGGLSGSTDPGRGRVSRVHRRGHPGVARLSRRAETPGLGTRARRSRDGRGVVATAADRAHA